MGKPNVGKSTLINFVVGKKVAIVTPRPQTTLKPILGVANLPDAQILFLDTPGIHRPRTRLGRAMVNSAIHTLGDADAVLFVVDVSRPPGEEDRRITNLLEEYVRGRVVAALNKMDRLRAEHVERNFTAYEQLTRPAKMMYTNALDGENIDKLTDLISELLPEAPAAFDDPSRFTDQTTQEMAAELVREKALLFTRQEVPHSIAVCIDEWQDADPQDEKPLVWIEAVIFVERKSQKPILIGRGGSMLKRIGTAAREDLERLLANHVYLGLRVKVRENWRDNPANLRELGLTR